MSLDIVKSAKWLTFSLIILITQPAWSADPKEDGKLVLAKNSIASVTRADFFTELSRLPEEYRGSVLMSMPRITQLVENLLLIKTMAAQARQLKIDSKPETQAIFALVIDKGLAQMRTEYLNNELAKEFKSKEAEFEARAKEVYKTEQGKYSTKASVRASHVLIGVDKRSKEDALKIAQDVRKQAVEGKAFDALALQYSEDPSVLDNKGDMGFFGPGKMVKPFEEAAFALGRPGDLTQPIETQFGYHVIRLEEKKPAGTLPYADVRSTIMGDLQAEYIKQKTSEHLAKINTDPSKVVNADALTAMKVSIDPKALERSKTRSVQ